MMDIHLSPTTLQAPLLDKGLSIYWDEDISWRKLAFITCLLALTEIC